MDSSGQYELLRVAWGCGSVLRAALEFAGVVHRHFITSLGEVNAVARVDNFLGNAHCYCCS